MEGVSEHIGSNVWCTGAWTLPRSTQPTLNILEPPAELSIPCEEARLQHISKLEHVLTTK